MPAWFILLLLFRCAFGWVGGFGKNADEDECHRLEPAKHSCHGPSARAHLLISTAEVGGGQGIGVFLQDGAQLGPGETAQQALGLFLLAHNLLPGAGTGRGERSASPKRNTHTHANRERDTHTHTHRQRKGCLEKKTRGKKR